ncbi:class I SAM-dependent methyltransferase [Rhodoferax sp. 4810]|uniref:Class I SAM-dependent methyltransferase n=1 Tax=Thiospirillum jenense TaxID=1653858 RepID=A0A839HA47_9GAMM|nr:class I SAM-dependent methyltransferase [Thiospirillum jenense]MBB1074186.1 class I SAM-dependent methyltransferase [Rhodoferax jenense]MBB1125260.1 class I SAM-dependent methyltransferase [Thiospirillum jenense]
MKRRPEIELMEDDDQAVAYAQADFRDANSRFVELVTRHWPAHLSASRVSYRALDLGCGPADIPLRLLRQYPPLQCDAVDGSAAMLAQATVACQQQPPQLAERLRLIEARVPLTLSDLANLAVTGALPVPAAGYDLIVSNSLLHHLPEPLALWQTIRAVAHLGSFVCVMDLMRPPEPSWAEALVKTYAADAPAVLQRDFRQSLCAAFEPAEVVAQLTAAGLGECLSVQVVSDRHLAVWGVLD